MRIVHISTYRSGGAGAAAWRLHMALLKAGVDSHFLSFEQKGNPAENWTTVNGAGKPFIQKIYWRMLGLGHRLQQILASRVQAFATLKQLKELRKTIPAEYISAPVSSWPIHLHPLVRSADIIHLHWVANVLDYASFFDNIKTPVVWTLHDLNPVMGCFHFPLEAKRFEAQTEGIDEKWAGHKSFALKTKKGGLHFIAPSHDFSLFVKERGFTERDISVIPYAIDQGIFCAGSKAELRKAAGFPTDSQVLLIAATHLQNHRKGFDLLLGALPLIPQTYMVLALGSKPIEINETENLRFTGFISNETILASYYAMADVVIIPSREDNLPNVMLEALACGIPVIGFKVGGLKDHIHPGITGLLAESLDSDGLAKAIKIFFQNKQHYHTWEIGGYAQKTFDPERIAGRHIELYRNILLSN